MVMNVRNESRLSMSQNRATIKTLVIITIHMTSQFCGNGAHVGYNCPAQVLSFQTLPSFPQQYPCYEDYGVTHELYQCQPENHDYYHEQNSFYDSNSFGFDHGQPPQYTVNHPIFNAHNAFLNSQNELSITQNKIMEQMTQLTSMCEMACQIIQKNQEEKQIEEEQAAKAQNSKILACSDDDDDYSAITPNEPIDSLSMGDEHLNTIPTTESDEFIKSCVENLVPNLSESEGENGCDVPACFITFSNILFDVEYEFDSSDDQSLSDEDFSKKIFSNPLFEEEIISTKIDPHHFDAKSDLIESMLNHDSSIISSSSKIDSFLDEYKDVANQEVKKDVSSLRYILLSNWAHDALLEYSSSKPHDESNTKIPEGSGNYNPTVSSSNPLADQMETLTVESPIPTVSSLVLTAFLNDSQESFSEARLISKRVANQEESPLLENILSLTNRFEDILGVTTSSNEAIGVEADVSDALQDPSWVEAMQEKLLQFKIQNVWTLVDCPKRVRPIGTKWVLKNKKDERGIVVRNKARLVAQGHTQEEGIDYDELFAPVARIKAIRLFLAYASFMGFTVYQMDVKSAFIYGTIDEEVYVMQPLGFQDPAFPAKGKDGTGKDADLHLYRSMIGSLMYLTASKPDIMFAVWNIVTNSREMPSWREIVSLTVLVKLESFTDSRMEEIDLTFTPDDPMLPSIEDDDNDSESDILILEKLPRNYSLSLPEIESFYFDIPSFSRPPAKPPDGDTGILNIKMMGDVSEQKLSAKYPMMIHGKNIPIPDVPLFHFYPLDQLKYGGNWVKLSDLKQALHGRHPMLISS
nr:putative ribonuclease H-like domain-containing protein [Tanacetum cinerariifolium]